MVEAETCLKAANVPAQAGRKAASTGSRCERQALVKKSIELGMLPLEYMLWVMRNKNVRKERRDAMAVAAAPYIHRKLAQALQLSDLDGEPLQVQVVKFTPPPQKLGRVIEAEKVVLPEETPVYDPHNVMRLEEERHKRGGSKA